MPLYLWPMPLCFLSSSLFSLGTSYRPFPAPYSEHAAPSPLINSKTVTHTKHTLHFFAPNAHFMSTYVPRLSSLWIVKALHIRQLNGDPHLRLGLIIDRIINPKSISSRPLLVFGGSAFISRVVALLLRGYRTHSDPQAFIFQSSPEGPMNLLPNLFSLIYPTASPASPHSLRRGCGRKLRFVGATRDECSHRIRFMTDIPPLIHGAGEFLLESWTNMAATDKFAEMAYSIQQKTDDTDAYFICLALDPNYKIVYAEHTWSPVFFEEVDAYYKPLVNGSITPAEIRVLLRCLETSTGPVRTV
ncbi:hypothetical protein B0H13DRAFT_1871045 [Mycena leptocephala]|nr:hypothetical protein B0H13DRAFT_1871045 [Mycena leptocephala]